MAYAAVSSLLQTIDILLTHYQHSISPQFENLMISIHQNTCFLRSFVEGSSYRVNNWEETIREATNKAEDIIELLLSDSLLESTIGSESKLKRRKYEHQLPYGFDELQRVTEEIEWIANRVKGGHTEATDDVNDQVTEIIFRLLGGSCELETIAIVGMSGIGKTTLAKNVYDNPLIVEHFDIRAWSACDDERGIILDLLHSLNKSKAESLSYSEDAVVISLRKILRGKRYLIVLDDISSIHSFDRLMLVLPGNENGSRLILTSRRDIDMSKYACHTQKIDLLDLDTTWDLLRQKIFKGDPCPSQLEHVGKMIARRCKGHLLSIDVVSRILAADQTQGAWDDISENIEIPYKGFERAPLRVLFQGYTYLPHHLRACFLYLGFFRRKKEINVAELIKLWVAEGFLNGSEGKSFEETGEERVKDLVQRGLVSVSKRKSDGRIKSIAIHDILRNLSQRQAQIDKFILYSKWFRPRMLQRCRRVSNFHCYSKDIVKGVYDSTIRTIMLYGDKDQLGVKCSLGNLRLLRILDLSNAYNCDLPEEVFELFHLRYLASNCWFSISEAISNLENLQTLIICSKNSGRIFDKLPSGVWRMPQLRHLLMFRLELPEPKGATSALQDLQTLSRVVDFVCSRENLKMFPNLKKLALLYYKNLREVVEDYELHNLVYLKKLEILKIEMEWSLVGQHKMCCAFPPMLKKLNLCGLQLSREDMKIVASLPNLEVLKLRNYACVGDTWETSEGGFPELKFLLIERSDLEHWITKSSHFPKLKCLVLRCCLRLLQVPDEIGEIPTLESIESDEQNQSLWRSAKQIMFLRYLTVGIPTLGSIE